MRWTVSILLLAACQAADHGGYPVTPGGGGGGGGGGGPDAAVDAAATGDGGATIAGRVCLIADLRALGGCAAAGADGLTVTLGTSTATTAADGGFTIATPAGTGLAWHVTGGAITPTVMPLGAVLQVPVITAAQYGQLLLDNGVVLTADQGTLVAAVTQTGAVATGATVKPSPAGTWTFYDGASATTWDQHTTGPAGVAWLPGTAAGTVSVTVVPATGASHSFVGLPIEAGAITFAALAL
jgi:hypothetical protein